MRLLKIATLAAACAFVVCLSGAACAQDQPVSTLTVNARIVVLDVVVTDKEGKVVNNLPQDAFTVYEDKVQQKVRYFEAPSQHVASASVVVNSTAELQQKAPDVPVTIIVLDEINSQFADMSYARYCIERYLNTQPKPLGQPTQLIAVDRQKFDLLHDYTQDPEAILTAMKKHQTAYPWMQNLNKTDTFGQVERLALSLGALEQITQANMGHAGRKNIIWVGRGYPGLNISNTSSDQDKAIRGSVQKVLNLMRDNRVTLYTVDPTAVNPQVEESISAGDLNSSGATGENGVSNGPGTPGPSAVISATGFDPMANVASFVKLAEVTGGRALYARNDVDTQMGKSIRDGANFYTMSYSPTSDSRASSAFRKIVVKVDRPGLKVATREGYYGDKIDIPVSAQNQLAFDLNSASNSNMTYTGLTISVARDGKTPNGFVVRIGSRDLSWKDAPDGNRKASVVVQAVSFGPKDKLLGRSVQGMALGIKPTTDVVSPGAAVSIASNPNPAPGAVRLRFVVRDQASGRIGTADFALQ